MAQGSLRGRLRAWTLATVLLAAACAAPQKPAPTPPAPAPPPAAAAPAPPPTPPQVSEAPPPTEACDAAALQYLVGKPHTDIPVPIYPSRRRVLCSTCVKTEDVEPYRTTIVYNTDTGLVTSVTCG